MIFILFKVAFISLIKSLHSNLTLPTSKAIISAKIPFEDILLSSANAPIA